jgi:serine/threonine protein kinase
MPRHWRCANGHEWTGDLGALTFCPDCGSADVYEVRPQWSGAGPPMAERVAQTFAQPALPKSVGDTLAQPAMPSVAAKQVGDTLVQPSLPPGKPAAVGETMIQAPALSAEVGQTLEQPALPEHSGDTLAQSADEIDAGTTQVQVYIPLDAANQTLEQAALSPGNGQTLEQPALADTDGMVIQPPATKEPSTADQPALSVDLPTLEQFVLPDPAEDAPTLLAAPSPGTAETRAFSGPADGASVSQAEAPTLDAPTKPADHPKATLDYPSTVSVHRPGREDMDTRPAAPLPPRPKDGRSGGPPPVEGYEIISVLGRGGMGVVYKARQVKLNRIVALKMILVGGHAGAYERQRFRTEYEAIAQLHHPNIVQIYETGERDGLPFFSLEFCDGGSLQQKLGGQPLPPRLAAEIAEQLARAMQYAHERGIIHRDLKPANILFSGEDAAQKPPSSKDSKAPTKDAGKPASKDSKVSKDAGKSVTQSRISPSFGSSKVGGSGSAVRATRAIPKITDFGLAKRLEEESNLTGSGTVLGTPSYMAPEQAAGQAKAVGPPADIHALGAILYEMLTGRPPFLGADVVDTMNQVRHLDPVPPTRIQPKTPRDLETVCLKCLQKEMHRRYAAAGDLADDLRRFLDGEPIAARPVSVFEKAWKWAKRRPAEAVLIGVVATVLVAAAVGGMAFARYQHQRAETETGLRKDAETAKENAEQQRLIAIEAFNRAEANFKSAREAVDDLLVRVGAERLEQVPRAEKLRKELLLKSLDFYQRFLTVHGDDPAVRREAGWAYQRLGRVRSDLGERKLAIAAYLKAAELFESLAREATDHRTNDQFDLAQTRRQLAVLFEADGRKAEADAAYNDARAALRTLADANADRPAYRRQLADLLLDRGGQFYNRRQLAEAEDAFRQSLTEFDRLCQDKPTVENGFARARAQANLGAVILAADRIAPAVEDLDKAVSLLTVVGREAPNNPEHVKELGQATFNLGTAQFKAGRPDDAVRTYREAIRGLAKLSADFPDVPEYRFVLALAYDNLAELLKNTVGLRKAEEERGHARELFDRLRRDVPGEPEYRLRYALALNEHAIFLANNDRIDEAIAEEKIGVELLSGLTASDPRNPDLGRVVRANALQHLNLGQLYAGKRQPDEADAEYALAISLLQGPADRRLKGDETWYDLPIVYFNQANLYQELRRDKAVERSMRRAVSVSQQIVAANPDQPDPHALLAKNHFFLASLANIKPAESLALNRDAVNQQRTALALAPKRPDLTVSMGIYGLRLVARLADEGDHAGAAAAAADVARDIPNWQALPQLSAQLVRCIGLARTDKTLTEDERQKKAVAYGEQALAVLRQSVANGFRNAAALRELKELEVLRTDPAFRPAFEKLLAEIK